MRIKCVRRSAAMIYPLPAPPVFHFTLSLSVDVLFPLLPDFVLVFGGILFITHWAKIKLTKKKHKIVHCSQREREEGSGIGQALGTWVPRALCVSQVAIEEWASKQAQANWAVRVFNAIFNRQTIKEFATFIAGREAKTPQTHKISFQPHKLCTRLLIHTYIHGICLYTISHYQHRNWSILQS